RTLLDSTSRAYPKLGKHDCGRFGSYSKISFSIDPAKAAKSRRSRGELFHFGEDRSAHLGGADQLAAFRLDIGGAEIFGERCGNGRVDQVGFLAHVERIAQRHAE